MAKILRKMCVLDETRECIECGECDRCDLDPNKICDNCMKCLQTSGADYRVLEIDDIIMDKNAAEGYEEEFDEAAEDFSAEETDDFFG